MREYRRYSPDLSFRIIAPPGAPSVAPTCRARANHQRHTTRAPTPPRVVVAAACVRHVSLPRAARADPSSRPHAALPDGDPRPFDGGRHWSPDARAPGATRPAGSHASARDVHSESVFSIAACLHGSQPVSRTSRCALSPLCRSSAAEALRPHAALSTSQSRLPVSWTVRRACPRERGAPPRARIHRPAYSAPFRRVYHAVHARVFLFRASPFSRPQLNSNVRRLQQMAADGRR